MCNLPGMATLTQRKKCDSEMDALNVARSFNLPHFEIPGFKNELSVKQEDDRFWVYLSISGETVPDGLPILPGFEKVE